MILYKYSQDLNSIYLYSLYKLKLFMIRIKCRHIQMKISHFTSILEEIKNYFLRKKGNNKKLNKISNLNVLLERIMIIDKKSTIQKYYEHILKIYLLRKYVINYKKTNYITCNDKDRPFFFSFFKFKKRKSVLSNKIYWCNQSGYKKMKENIKKIFQVNKNNSTIKNIELKKLSPEFNKINCFTQHLTLNTRNKFKNSLLFFSRINRENCLLQTIKKLNYSKKFMNDFAYSFLNTFFLTETKKNLISNFFLTNTQFSEKETKIKILLEIFTWSFNFLNHKHNEFKKKTPEEFGKIEQKNRTSKYPLRKSYLLLSFVQFVNATKRVVFRYEKKRQPFSKSSIYPLKNLFLFEDRFLIFVDRVNLKKRFCLLFNTILIKLTIFFSRKKLFLSNHNQIKIIFRFFSVFLAFNKNFYKKYFLTFLHRIKDRTLFFISSSFFKSKSNKKFYKINNFFNLIQNLSEKILFISHSNLRNQPFCKLCLIKNFFKINIFMKKKILDKFVYVDRLLKAVPSSYHLKILTLNILVEFVCSKIKKKLSLLISIKKYDILCLSFWKICKKKFYNNYSENKIFFEFIVDIEQFQEKFLFIVFLFYRGFFFKFSIVNNYVKNYESSRQKISTIYIENNFFFLLNFFYSDSTQKKSFKRFLVTSWTERVELLMIIGPNRDLSKIRTILFHNLSKNRVLKKNLDLGCTRLIYLFHFSRFNRVSFFNYHIFEKKSDKLSFKGHLVKTANLILKSMDKKLIRSFLLFENSINKKRSNLYTFISRYLLFDQISHNIEIFHERINTLFSNRYQLPIHCPKKKTQKFKKNFLLSDSIILFEEGKTRDQCEMIFSPRNFKELVQNSQFKSSLDIMPIAIISLIIPVTSKIKFNIILFNQLCFFNFTNSYLLQIKFQKKFQKTSLDFLNVFEILIRKNLWKTKKKFSNFFKQNYGIIFQIELLKKLIQIIEKKSNSFTKIQPRASKNNLTIKFNLVCDFSERPLSDIRRSIRKL